MYGGIEKEMERKYNVIIALLLLALGIVSGLAISSRLDLMNTGLAQDKSGTTISVKTSPTLMGLMRRVTARAPPTLPYSRVTR